MTLSTWVNAIKHERQRKYLGTQGKKYENVLTLTGKDCEDIFHLEREGFISTKTNITIFEKDHKICKKIDDTLSSRGFKYHLVNDFIENGDFVSIAPFDLVNLDFTGTLDLRKCQLIEKIPYAEGAELHLVFSSPRGKKASFIRSIPCAILKMVDGSTLHRNVSNKLDNNMDLKYPYIPTLLNIILRSYTFNMECPNPRGYTSYRAISKMNVFVIKNIHRLENPRSIKLSDLNFCYDGEFKKSLKKSKACNIPFISATVFQYICEDQLAMATRLINSYKEKAVCEGRLPEKTVAAIKANCTRKLNKLSLNPEHDKMIQSFINSIK